MVRNMPCWESSCLPTHSQPCDPSSVHPNMQKSCQAGVRWWEPQGSAMRSTLSPLPPEPLLLTRSFFFALLIQCLEKTALSARAVPGDSVPLWGHSA